MGTSEGEGVYSDAWDIVQRHFQENRREPLYERVHDILVGLLGDTVDVGPLTERVVNEVDQWLPKQHNTNSQGWNGCLEYLRSELR